MQISQKYTNVDFANVNGQKLSQGNLFIFKCFNFNNNLNKYIFLTTVFFSRRANALISLEDKTGSLDASIIGHAAEKLLETNADVLMNYSPEVKLSCLKFSNIIFTTKLNLFFIRYNIYFICRHQFQN